MEIKDSQGEQRYGAMGTAFAVLVGVLILQKSNIGSPSIYPLDAGPFLVQTASEDNVFDFIIVGGGTSGCVLANRLSELQKWKVLVLEAGDIPTATSEIPALYPTLIKSSEDWDFMVEHNNNYCQGVQTRRCTISSGKALGGSTVISNMHYTHAPTSDFDCWMLGAGEEWKPHSIKTTYSQLESNLKLKHFCFCNPIKNVIFDAAREMKYERLFAVGKLGYLQVNVALDNGTRQNAAKAFLAPIKSRENLLVARNARALRIIMNDPRDKKADAVEVDIDGHVIQLRARKEVILAAGSINTPKILMLSGIGPADHLKSLEIPVQLDLKVGYNFQMHFGVPVFVSIDANKVPSSKDDAIVEDTYNYLMYKKGPFADININDIVGYINTRDFPFDTPNVAIYHYYFQANDKLLPDLLEKLEFDQPIAQSIMKANWLRPLVVFFPSILKPKSVGRVLLKSTNSSDPPKIEGKFLSKNEDIYTLIAGYKYVLKFIKTQALKNFGAELVNVDIPKCRNLKVGADPYIKCVIKNVGFPIGQAVGTTKMGAVCDQNSVVGSTLVVKGVRGLRVADGSVMPEIVSGSTQATIGMIGERAATLISSKWSKGYKQGKSICAGR